MNTLKQAISQLFGSPMQGMSYVAYMQYINSNGKITAKSLLDLCTVLMVYMDEYEKKTLLHEENFKEVQEILSKLVDKKTETTEPSVKPAESEWFKGLERLDDNPPNTGNPDITVVTAIKPTPDEKVNESDDIWKQKIDLPPEDKETYRCIGCGKVLSSRVALMGHMRSHKQK